MSTSQAYLDVVGSLDYTWPAAYNTVIQNPCDCGAGKFEVCTNAATGRPRKMPCLTRLHFA